MNTKKAIATAEYLDSYCGWTRAYLVPFKTTRRGQRLTCWRWNTEKGGNCGLNAGYANADYMLSWAHGSRLMRNVAICAEGFAA